MTNIVVPKPLANADFFPQGLFDAGQYRPVPVPGRARRPEPVPVIAWKPVPISGRSRRAVPVLGTAWRAVSVPVEQGGQYQY